MDRFYDPWIIFHTETRGLVWAMFSRTVTGGGWMEIRWATRNLHQTNPSTTLLITVFKFIQADSLMTPCVHIKMSLSVPPQVPNNEKCFAKNITIKSCFSRLFLTVFWKIDNPVQISMKAIGSYSLRARLSCYGVLLLFLAPNCSLVKDGCTEFNLGSFSYSNHVFPILYLKLV